jgi:long-chain acyl-CoA synthetase
MTKDPIVREFERLVRRAPRSALVVSPRTTSTVEDVNALALCLARRLRAEAPTAGFGVALAVPNGPGFLSAYLAVHMAGGIVGLLDGRTPGPERLRVARALRLGMLLRGPAWPDDPVDFHIEHVDSPAGDPVGPFDEALSTIRVTSGSTGTPRGILVTARALLADDRQLASTMALRDDERILGSIPMSHSYGLSSVVMPALVRGSLIVMPDDGGPFGAIEASRTCEVTFFPTTPAFLEAFLKLNEAPLLPSTLRLVVCAGAPLRPATAVRFRETHGRAVHVFYGASECGGIAFDREGHAGERGTVGTPVDGVTIDLEPAAGKVDDIGRVRVRSAAVATAYHPLRDDSLCEGCFHSQDLGTFVDRELKLLGRVDDQINVRGKKVNPREVETLLGGLQGVAEASVVGVDDSDAAGQLVLAVVATSDPELNSERILAWCRSRLAAHKVPRRIIVVDRIPRTSRGKIDRAALKQLAQRDP